MADLADGQKFAFVPGDNPIWSEDGLHHVQTRTGQLTVFLRDMRPAFIRKPDVSTTLGCHSRSHLSVLWLLPELAARG